MNPRRAGVVLAAAGLWTATGCLTTRPSPFDPPPPEASGPAGQEFHARRFAGVRLFLHPDGISVIVRGGITSFQAGTAPLYIVDGIEVATNERGRLVGINPHDIESIRVLKTIDETAFYGSRGANGVVLIRTRRGQ